MIVENSLDVWLENQVGQSVCKEHTKNIRTDESGAVGVIGWLGVAGFLITIGQILKKNIYDKYNYIPLWRRGKDDQKYSYEFSRKVSDWDPTDVFENFLKSVIQDETPKFGFLFGDRKDNHITIEAILPAKELGIVLDKYLDTLPDEFKGPYRKKRGKEKKKDTELKNVLQKISLHGPKEKDVRTAIHLLLSKKDGVKLSKEKISMAKKELVNFTRTGVWKSLTENRWKKIPYLRNKFLGTYYYEPELREHSWKKEDILKKMNTTKLKTKLNAKQLEKKIDELKTKCNIEKTIPKFLFFDNKQFEKIDEIMKGSKTFFINRRQYGKNLPILVCMDKNSVTAKCMCLGYKTNEKLYKRLRNYKT
jgi:hypothetical protein